MNFVKSELGRESFVACRRNERGAEEGGRERDSARRRMSWWTRRRESACSRSEAP